MTGFVVISALLAVLALVLLTRPLWRRGTAAADATGMASLREQQEQLAALTQSGVLGEAQYIEARQTLERRITEATANAPGRAASAQATTAKPLMAGVATFVCALTVAGYAWLGTPRALNSELVAAAAAPIGPDRPLTPEQVEAMIETLSARVKEHPNEAESWAMLGRAQVVLGRHAQAVPALKQAVALRGDDATLLTEYADALAVVNGRTLDGEPSRLLAQALAIEPNNTKALLLSGMHAFQQKDYAKALQRWEKVVQLSPGGELATQLQGVIAEARQRAGGAAPTAAAPASAATAETAATAPGTSVSGTVTLAPALAAKARPAPCSSLRAPPRARACRWRFCASRSKTCRSCSHSTTAWRCRRRTSCHRRLAWWWARASARAAMPCPRPAICKASRRRWHRALPGSRSRSPISSPRLKTLALSQGPASALGR